MKKVVEVDFRGVIQDQISRMVERFLIEENIKKGRSVLSYLRWNDSPQRVGIPAKRNIIISDTVEEGEGESIYSPAKKDVSIVLDDTLCMGTCSAANLGVENPAQGLVEKGYLVVWTERDREILKYLPKVGYEYSCVFVKGKLPFDGMWAPVRETSRETVYMVIGAIARWDPYIVDYEDAREALPKKEREYLIKGYETSTVEVIK